MAISSAAMLRSYHHITAYYIFFAGDVGLARIMDASHMTTGLAPCGTFAYAAPELLMGTRCDEKVHRHDLLLLRG